MVVATPTRAAIEEKYKWDLAPIYPDDGAWEAALDSTGPLLDELASYAGRLGSSPQTLQDALVLYERVSRLSDRVWQYAARNRDEDMTSARSQSLFDRASQLGSKVESTGAFIQPEIVALPAETLSRFMQELPELRMYAHYFDRVLRSKPYLLSPGEEALLAKAGEMAGTPHLVYKMLTDADLDFGSVMDEHGVEVALTSGTNYVLLASPERRVREETYRKMMGAYMAHRNTIAASFSGNVKKNNFFAEARGHRSALEAALHIDNIPVAVYDSLFATVKKHSSLLRRYMELRKRVLGLDVLRPYDLYPSLAPEWEEDVPYDNAVESILAALEPLGADYVGRLRAGLDARWVDVYETPNKRSGAHSGGAYDTYPYTMLNYQPKPIWRNTLAHELSHAMHSYYSGTTQPYIYGYPSDFLGEIAATVNEQMLSRYLLDHAEHDAKRLAILSAKLEKMRHGIFRQTMLAEFERNAHEAAGRGEALTAEWLSEMFARVVHLYHGASLDIDDLAKIEWASIPHFYIPFFVYQYATAEAAAVALARQIMEEGEPAAARYRRLLSSGSSGYTIDLLREAGVDMSTPEPVEQALGVFEEILVEVEGLCGV